jgi:hypothetical protein
VTARCTAKEVGATIRDRQLHGGCELTTTAHTLTCGDAVLAQGNSVISRAGRTPVAFENCHVVQRSGGSFAHERARTPQYLRTPCFPWWFLPFYPPPPDRHLSLPMHNGRKTGREGIPRIEKAPGWGVAAARQMVREQAWVETTQHTRKHIQAKRLTHPQRHHQWSTTLGSSVPV